MDIVTGKREHRLGFVTNAFTRPVIISELKRRWKEDNTIECDRETLLEMLSFVKNDSGKPEAMQGKHDDLVLALAIAHHVSTQAGHEWLDGSSQEADWIQDHFNVQW